MTGSRKFFLPGDADQYAPDLNFTVKHLVLDISIDPEKKLFGAVAEYELRVLQTGLKTFDFDFGQDSDVQCEVDGQKADPIFDDRKLRIPVYQALLREQIVTVKISYKGRDPKVGLYFTGPDAHYPQKPFQVWSQGQDQDNHHWFPCPDYPNQKFTTEMKIKVPKDYVAISNGSLVRKEAGFYHYKMSVPHVSYLVSIAVGKFESWSDVSQSGVPLNYFVQCGLLENGKRAFGNTAAMVDVFEKHIGVKYPYESYTQTAVQDFVAGGMENTTATTQTDRVLHDERAALDFTADFLVAHELAHQWFGDLLTCRDWSHAWLNEGFATFFESVWLENDTSPKGGADAAKYARYMNFKDYLNEDSQNYRRPIVCKTFSAPMDLFDRHLYEKGSLVINLLRAELGAEDFWKVIREYVNSNRGKNVETLDLIRSIETVTGKNFRRFFDQWVFGEGFPVLKATLESGSSIHPSILKIVQGKGDSQEGFFHLTIPVGLHFKDGSTKSESIVINGKSATLTIANADQLNFVTIDPDNTIPKLLDFTRPLKMIRAQMEADPSAVSRIQALEDCAKLGTSDAQEILGNALVRDSFWGVQVQAAKLLEKFRSSYAKTQFKTALKVPHPKARRAAVRALSAFNDASLAQDLEPIMKSDPSYFVAAEATEGWFRVQLPLYGSFADSTLSRFQQVMNDALKTESFADVVGSAAIRGAGELPGLALGHYPELLEFLKSLSCAGINFDRRAQAIATLVSIARKSIPAVRAPIVDLLDLLSKEDDFRIRKSLVSNIRQSQLEEAESILRWIETTERDAKIRRAALAGRIAIQEGADKNHRYELLKEEFETWKIQQRKWMDDIEKRLAQK